MAVLWLIHGGDPNHLLHGMILQVVKMSPRFRRRHPRHPQVSVPRPSRRPPHHLAANPATSTRQSSEMLREAVSTDGFDHLGGIFVVSFSGWWLNPPSEKYMSKWESSPNRGENKTYLKPPPSFFWVWKIDVFLGKNWPTNFLNTWFVFFRAFLFGVEDSWQFFGVFFLGQ